MINNQASNPAGNAAANSASKPMDIPVQDAVPVKTESVPAPLPAMRRAPSEVPPQTSLSPPPKETARDQESCADASERTAKEDVFIVPSNNDIYHEKILSLLKISNNRILNTLYYKVVPQISKSTLLSLDLSATLTVFIGFRHI